MQNGKQHYADFVLVAHGDSFGAAMSPKYWKLTFTPETLKVGDSNGDDFVPSPAFEGNEQAFEQDLILLMLTQYAYTVGSFRGSVR